MKKLFILSALIISTLAFSQEEKQFLEIDYQLEMVMDFDQIISNVPSEYRAMVEEPLRQELNRGIFIDYQLKTNGTESEYKMQTKINNDQSATGMILSQISAMDKEPLYKDIDQQYFLKPYNVGRAYLVKDSLADFQWKITREKEQIAGFDTYKATGVMNDSIAITAWYTPKINIKDGPDRIWGLPGLILKTEFEMMGSTMITTAINVAVKEEEIKIDKPSKGKVLTEKEFYEEMIAMQEKMKEMYSESVEVD